MKRSSSHGTAIRSSYSSLWAGWVTRSQPPIWIGLRSTGSGGPSLETALRHPERISALLILGTRSLLPPLPGESAPPGGEEPPPPHEPTIDDVRHIAALARLGLTDDRAASLLGELNTILAHMDVLSQVDTEGVEPMSQVLYEAEETATLRPDVERAPLGNDIALANGGTCEGPPGPRGEGFYAGYFRDPDGNKLNAFVMG